MIALSVAAALAVFILYTAVVGGATTQVSPSKLAGHTDHVSLVGAVVGPVTGDAHGAGLRFRVKDVSGSSKVTVPVVYHGSVPDLFKVGRHIVVDGRLRNGTFVAVPGSLITKCPSKYAPKQSGTSA